MDDDERMGKKRAKVRGRGEENDKKRVKSETGWGRESVGERR